jgi:flavin-dependent thymidylate synthase
MEMEFKEPIVTLTSMTDDPLLAIFTGWEIMLDNKWEVKSKLIKEYLEETDPRRREAIIPEDSLIRIFREALASPRKGVLEQVHFTFMIENVSRAFQQQLTRHRVGFSFSIQSLRMVHPGEFATEQNYHVPRRLRAENKKDELVSYHMAMSKAQAHYIRAVKDGVKEEDARNGLPLAIFSPITVGCTYLALMNMMAQRLCPSTQGEFRQVAKKIYQAVTCRYPILAEGFTPFCDPYKRCLVQEERCGRWSLQPMEQRENEPNRSIDLMAEPE